MRWKGQLQALAGATFASLAVALLLAVSASAAFPPDLTDTFDSGDDGWSIYDGSTIGAADWVQTGGNPGGFIASTNSGAAGDASFGDAGYVEHLSRYSGRARIVADLRTSATGAGAPGVSLVDSDYPAFGSIHSTARAPLSAEWQHYAFPLDAAGGWFDDAGDRLDAGELHRFLNLDPVILIGADYGSTVGARTDLDNVGLITEFPRGISIVPKRNGFKGRITIKEGFDAPECLADQKVKVLRVRKGNTRTFGKATTDADGKYVVKRKPKPGRYFAQAPVSHPATGPKCGAAMSKTIKVKH